MPLLHVGKGPFLTSHRPRHSAKHCEAFGSTTIYSRWRFAGFLTLLASYSPWSWVSLAVLVAPIVRVDPLRTSWWELRAPLHSLPLARHASSLRVEFRSRPVCSTLIAKSATVNAHRVSLPLYPPSRCFHGLRSSAPRTNLSLCV